jgi:hypothetical protein
MTLTPLVSHECWKALKNCLVQWTFATMLEVIRTQSAWALAAAVVRKLAFQARMRENATRRPRGNSGTATVWLDIEAASA